MLYLKLNEILQKRNKSMYWLSKNTGIAQNHISKMCNGETTSIRFDSLEKICTTLECPLNELFYTNNPSMEKYLSGGEK